MIRPSAEGDIAASGIIRMPDRTMGPTGAILRRLVVALLALVLTVLVVYLGRDGYKDNNGDGVSLLDSIY
ncbi:MAG TPA: potassium transporter Kef, partial [Pseudonocardia sp.]|nr:potassium transporter Kef [Pseudonocardia sp.]